jgi:3-deoxy-D-manno-octulosonic-acid transferase
MFILYDLIFLIVSIFYLPVYLLKKKFHSGFLLRLGRLPKNLSLDEPIWVHAVSVGEAMAIKSLTEELRRAYPNKRFVISTVTVTGNKIAKAIIKEGDFLTYLPLDFSFIVRSVLARIKPSIFIIAETEIWPNIIWHLYRRNVPIIIVNGRVSDKSFRGYSAIKFLLKPILRKIAIFCVQTENDARRFLRLGLFKDKIQITGNMKFDATDYTDKRNTDYTPACRQAGILEKDYTDYKIKLGLTANEKIFVAGSTHHGEEELILAVYKELRTDFPNLRLLIVPRHPERSKDIGEIVSRFGFHSVYVSSLSSGCPSCMPRAVFILDTIGELIPFYAIADIVFVGGSLVKKGGHNILEPAGLSKPIIFGPYMFNFRDIADLFLSNRAAIKVYSPQDLKANIAALLNNPSEALTLGQRALQLILQNQGATKRNAELIIKAVASYSDLR